MYHNFTYEQALTASLRVNWKVEDLINATKSLDFSKPFMPERLAQVEGLTFLNRDEQRILNQIRGHAYLCIFGLVEEFILPFVLDHARPQLDADDHRTRALLQFASEEAKHIQLFKRFREAFQDGFGHACDVIGPPQAVAEFVLSHHPLAVALTTLHIEWMVQRHYLEGVHDNQDLDAQFKSLLKHHWMEECQHAKLDTLIVEALAERCTPAEIDQAVEEYLKIGGFIDDGLKQQVEFDRAAFESYTGRRLNEAERARFGEVQLQANRWTYIGTAMTHPNFLQTLGHISPAARARIESIAPMFC